MPTKLQGNGPRRHNISGVFLIAGMSVLLGCNQRPAAQAPAPAPSRQQPSAGERPVATPPPTDATSTVQAPARDDAANSPTGLHGFGPAKFGDGNESVRMAWGMPFKDVPPQSESCYYLIPEAPNAGIAFMLVDGLFKRYDVDGPRHVAPGGGKVGDTAQDILRRYPGQVERQNHKYVEGAHYWVVTPKDGTPVRLVFETDASDTVKEWRVGLPPAVHFVEGCS